MSREIRADHTRRYLLPPAVEDWVPEDHPARFVMEIVETLDFKELGFKERKGDDGRPNYSNDLLLRVWLYGYMERIRSTRRLEKACMNHMALIWLTGNNAPDHNTLWRFFKRNKKALKRLFKKVVKTAFDAGLIEMALHAVDGTKFRAKCSREGVISREDAERMLSRIDDSARETISEIERNEKRENWEYRIPEELTERGKLRKKIVEALEIMDEKGKNFHIPEDPDAVILKVDGRKLPGYNAQAVADRKSGMVVAEDVVNEEHDQHQLSSMLDEVKENVGDTAETTVADAGYYTGEELSKAGGSVLVNPMPQADDNDEFHWSRFTYDEQSDCVICPMGERLEFSCIDNSEREPRREYKCRKFRECPRRFDCSKNKRMGRRIRICPHHQAKVRNIEKLRIEENRTKLKKRKAIIEPVFGIIKECSGFRRFSVGGLDNVKAQWSLICTAFNLKKMYKHWTVGKLRLSHSL